MKSFKLFIRESYEFEDGGDRYQFYDDSGNVFEIRFYPQDHDEPESAGVDVVMTANGKYLRVDSKNPMKILTTRVKIIKQYLDSNPDVPFIDSDPVGERRGILWKKLFQRAGLNTTDIERHGSKRIRAFR